MADQPSEPSGHSPDDATILPSGGRGGPGAADAFERAGDEIGPYRLIAPLGEGGFGTVWLAERRRPFVQRVALKVIKAGMDSRAVVARFEQERQALAVMSHPNIAKVLDGGVTPAGRPYFAMEHVAGEPITEYCDRRRLPVDARLRLFELACEAVQHAHLKGIIHRDLKPGNILAFDAEGGEPSLKIIDFGIAKAVSPGASAHTVFTETGQMIGSMDYMSPEQADPTGAGIDTRSDIYSLGVLLYELVTGALPFEPSELRSKAYREVQRIIQEEDPPTPSARLSTIATRDRERVSRIEKARGVTTQELMRDLRRELEWIPLKAMRKEPRLRYQAAMDLAEDIRNYRAGRPLVAAPESTAYRLRKYLRRHGAVAAAAAAVTVSLVAGFGVSAWQWWRAARSEAVAIQARDEAVALRAEAESQARRAEQLLYASAAGQALEAAKAGDDRRMEQDLRTAGQAVKEPRFETRLARAMVDDSLFRFGTGSVLSVAFSPDGRIAATGNGIRGTVELFDAATGAATLPSITVPSPADGQQGALGITALAFSPDSRLLAVAAAANEGAVPTVSLWDVATRRQVGEALAGPQRHVSSLRFAAGGTLLLGAALDGMLWSWKLGDGSSRMGRVVMSWQRRAGSLEVSDDGSRAASSDGSMILLFDPAADFAPVVIEKLVGLRSFALDPTGAVLVAGFADGSIRWFDAASGKSIESTAKGLEQAVVAIAFSPDGSRFVTGSMDRTLRVWDTSTRRQIGRPRRGATVFESIDIAWLGSERIAVADLGSGGACAVWDVSQDRSVDRALAPAGPSRFLAASASRGAELIALSSDSGLVHVVDPVSGAFVGCPIGVLPAPNQGDERPFAWHPDGRRFLMVPPASDCVEFFDALTGLAAEPPLDARGASIVGIDVDPSGKLLVAVDRSRRALIFFDLPSRAPVGDPLSLPGVRDAWFVGDGSAVVALVGGDLVRIDVNSRMTVGDPVVASKWIRAVFVSQDRRRALVDLATSREIWDLPVLGPTGISLDDGSLSFQAAGWSPDGQTLAVTYRDESSLRLFSAASGRRIGESLFELPQRAAAVTFTPSGDVLVAAGAGARFFDAVPVRDRIGGIRSRAEQVDAVAGELAAELATIDGDLGRAREVQARVIGSGRFTGDRRIAALIAIRRAYDAKRSVADARAEELTVTVRKVSALLEVKRIAEALDAARSLGDDFADPQVLNQLAWLGTTELPPGDPARDLDLLLAFAARAVEASSRKDSSVLDTLARVHWERGELDRAIEVQREAVGKLADVRREDAVAKETAQAIRDALAQYEREAAGRAAPPAAAGDAPR